MVWEGRSLSQGSRNSILQNHFSRKSLRASRDIICQMQVVLNPYPFWIQNGCTPHEKVDQTWHTKSEAAALKSQRGVKNSKSGTFLYLLAFYVMPDNGASERDVTFRLYAGLWWGLKTIKDRRKNLFGSWSLSDLWSQIQFVTTSSNSANLCVPTNQSIPLSIFKTFACPSFMVIWNTRFGKRIDQKLTLHFLVIPRKYWGGTKFSYKSQIQPKGRRSRSLHEKLLGCDNFKFG